MLRAFRKSCSSAASATGIAAATGVAAAADVPITFQLNWMAGGPNAGFAAARRARATTRTPAST